MYAIGNDELKKLSLVGNTVKCKNCEKTHTVKYGDRILEDGTKEKSKLLGFVKCGKKLFLVAVDGKRI